MKNKGSSILILEKVIKCIPFKNSIMKLFLNLYNKVLSFKSSYNLHDTPANKVINNDIIIYNNIFFIKIYEYNWR